MREIYTCATCTRSDCAAKIKGKWQSDLATMTYDFERGYIARQVAILNPEVYRGKIIKCEKDYMVYKNPHGETMVRFLSINKIKLSGEGKLTFEFRRISGDLSVIENHIK